jgi:hypothetical protein
MANTSISEFYDQILSDKGFQIPETGDLFFPAYIYTYNPKDEYVVRQEIENLKDRLIRPNNFVDALIINIFHEFIDYLDTLKLGNNSLYTLLLEKDKSNNPPEVIIDIVKREANSREFFDYINCKVEKHFISATQHKRVYLLLYGFGSIFPFLRTSNYLKNFEEHVKGYKLIVFYPGRYESKNYHLFDEFNDENIYRAVPIDALIKR